MPDPPVARKAVLIDGRGDLGEVGGTAAEPWGVRAVLGALGLTGVCTEIEVGIRPVTTGWLLVDSHRCESPDDLFALLDNRDSDTYSYARLDTGPRRVGRGIVVTGRQARVADLPDIRQPTALEYIPYARTRSTSRLPNRAWATKADRLIRTISHATAPAKRLAELMPLAAFFHSEWETRQASKVESRSITYDFSVPLGEEELLSRFLHRLVQIQAGIDVATLKRTTRRSGGPLSVNVDGWNLSIEIAPDTPGIGRLLDEWDEHVLTAGGQVALSTDSRIRAELVPTMYPALQEWFELREILDPNRRFASDLSRRLEL